MTQRMLLLAAVPAAAGMVDQDAAAMDLNTNSWNLGRHIEVTPERKKIMDDAIWEVVKGHPYTQVK